ncbi:MAG: OmpA family protein [Pseudomonadaceae bacterium]|nr:OmpA family protein [Pseudomonadaceae bacterium]
MAEDTAPAAAEAPAPAPAAGGGGGGGQVIVIKKKNRGGGHGHHGGAWKVAYADFVTAMMAFFLLLWLLATTSEEQKQGIAHYFNPPNNASEYGGGSGIMGGTSPVAEDTHAPKEEILPPKDRIQDDLQLQAEEDNLFRQLSQQMTKAMMNIPELRAMLDSLIVDITPEGMRIQMTDKEGRPLFVDGTAEPYGYTRKMLAVVANVLATLPNKLAVGGHTTAVPFRGASPAYTNWELSGDRAQVARRVMQDEGIMEKRMQRVAGYAAQELLVVDHPADVRNARLSVIVLRSKRAPVAAFSQEGLIAPRAGPGEW